MCILGRGSEEVMIWWSFVLGLSVGIVAMLGMSILLWWVLPSENCR